MKFKDRYNRVVRDAMDNLLLTKTITPDDNSCGVWWNGSMQDQRPLARFTDKTTGKIRAVFVQNYILARENPDLDLPQRFGVNVLCGNPRCLNPDHLAVKTGGDGMTLSALRALIFFKENIMRLGSIGRVADEIGINQVTLGNMLRTYRRDPDRWDKAMAQLLEEDKNGDA